MNYEICLRKALAIETGVKLVADKVGCSTSNDLSVVVDNLYETMSNLGSPQISWVCNKEDYLLIKMGAYLRNRLVRQQRTKDGLVPIVLELESVIQTLVDIKDINVEKAKELAIQKSKDSKKSFSSFEEWSKDIGFAEVAVWLDLALSALDKWACWEVCLKMTSLQK